MPHTHTKSKPTRNPTMDVSIHALWEKPSVDMSGGRAVNKAWTNSGAQSAEADLACKLLNSVHQFAFPVTAKLLPWNNALPFCLFGPVLQLRYAQIWDFYSQDFFKYQKQLDWGLCKHHQAYLIRKASLPADTEVKVLLSSGRCGCRRLALLLARDCPKPPWVMGHYTAYINLPCVWDFQY